MVISTPTHDVCMLMSNEFESEYHVPLLSNKPCFLFFCYHYYLFYFILFYLFYKFISNEHLNEKGIHPFLWFDVRCVR